jgi:hypothetical protein
MPRPRRYFLKISCRDLIFGHSSRTKRIHPSAGIYGGECDRPDFSITKLSIYPITKSFLQFRRFLAILAFPAIPQ